MAGQVPRLRPAGVHLDRPDHRSDVPGQHSRGDNDNYQSQIVNLARTTLRNIIGTMTLKSANSELQRTLRDVTGSWGIEIVRTEIKKAEILEAEGEARAIQLVNDAADKYFVGNAQVLRRLEMAGVLPLPAREAKKEKG